jgi:leucyl-tRNA synthetase
VTHHTIARVTRDLEDAFHFNTALAALMELQNALAKFQEPPGPTPPASGGIPASQRGQALAFAEGVTTLVVMLAPFAPHLAEELWEMLGHRGSIFRQVWPVANPVLAQQETVEVVMQVNGKVRSRQHVPRGTVQDRLRDLALSDSRVQSWIGGKTVRKVIVIPDRLVNIVVGS